MYPWIVELRQHTESIKHLDKTLFEKQLFNGNVPSKRKGQKQYV